MGNVIILIVIVVLGISCLLGDPNKKNDNERLHLCIEAQEHNIKIPKCDDVMKDK